MKEHGVEKFGRLIDQNIAQATYLTGLINAEPMLELRSDTSINIVCYRYNPGNKSDEALKRINIEIMLQMQETGAAAVSDTTIQGAHCLRVAINNHRTITEDLDFLVKETVRLGDAIVGDCKVG